MISEQMKEFIKENNIQTVEDIQSVLKSLFAETLQGSWKANRILSWAIPNTMKLIRPPTIGEMDIVPSRFSAIMVKWNSRFPDIVKVNFSR